MCLKAEALKRMKLLKLHQNVIDEFSRNKKLNKSEYPLASLYWLTNAEKQLVDEFEKNNKGTLVYHLIKSNTKDLGIIYDLLYITEDREDWPIDREFLKDNLVLSHTITNEEEDGRIKIKKKNGGLLREY